jgi:hypothetical protein
MKLIFVPTLLAAVVSITFMAMAAVSPEEDYIKVEVRGTIRTGVMAIGAETTGTIIQSKNVRWELDLGGNKELREQVGKLDGKTAVVTGAYELRKGVEVRERHVVKVVEIKEK